MPSNPRARAWDGSYRTASADVHSLGRHPVRLAPEGQSNVGIGVATDLVLGRLVGREIGRAVAATASPDSLIAPSKAQQIRMECQP